MIRLRFVVLAAALLPGCQCHVDYGHPIDTKEIAKSVIESMAHEGVPLTDVDCGDSYYYRKDQDTLTCKGTVEGQRVDVAIQFHDATHFDVRTDLPGVSLIATADFVAFVAERYGSDVTVKCPDKLVFWTGHDTQPCQLTVEGETHDATVRLKGTEVFLEPDREKVLDAGWMERQLVHDLDDIPGMDAKVDCGKPRLQLRRPGRGFDCRFSWDGGEGRTLAAPEREGVGFVVIETVGLSRQGLEGLLAMFPDTPAGATWSCPEKVQIVRGQALHCELVMPGGKRRSIEIAVNEAARTYQLTPPP